MASRSGSCGRRRRSYFCRIANARTRRQFGMLMRSPVIAALAALLAFAGWQHRAAAQSAEPMAVAPPATAAPPAPVAVSSGDVQIEWEVKNRFRLFRREADFQRHVAAAQAGSLLGAEHVLDRGTEGRGWAQA